MAQRVFRRRMVACSIRLLPRLHRLNRPQLGRIWSRSSQATRYLGRGSVPSVYENADFIRVKDITLSYDFSRSTLTRIGIDGIRLFVTGKNLITITDWGALDPELDNQRAIPLQKEYMFGLNVTF